MAGERRHFFQPAKEFDHLLGGKWSFKAFIMLQGTITKPKTDTNEMNCGGNYGYEDYRVLMQSF